MFMITTRDQQRTAVFAQRLRDVRTLIGMSQEELSQRSGVPLHTLRRLEQGETEKPNLFDILDIGQALGFNPTEMAAMFDAWKIEERSPLTGPAAPTIRRLARYLDSLPREEVRQLTLLLDAVIDVHGQRQKREDKILLTDLEQIELPEWLANRISPV